MSKREHHIVSSQEQSVEADELKVSRISDTKIAFVQQAYAAGASEKLDERRRIFLAHAVTKPHLTLQELAPFAGVGLARASGLFKTGLQELWQASPPELQRKYPLALLLTDRRIGVHFSPEHRARISESKKGKRFSPEHKAKLGESKRGKTRKPFSPETRAKISEAKKGKPASEAQLAHIRHLAELRKGKKLNPHSPETRAKMSEAYHRRRQSPEYWENRIKMSEEQLERLRRTKQATQQQQSEEYSNLMESWYYPAEQVVFDANSPRE